MARRVPRHVEFFVTLDSSCKDPSELNQDRLLALFNARGLRLAENIVAFLVRRFEIQWDRKLSISYSANKQTQETISAADGQPWSNDVKKFQKYLQEKKLSPRTIRSYITAATALLWHARVERTADLTQRHVNGWLHLRRGRANDLLSFVKWIRAHGGSELQVRGRPLTPAKKREKKILSAAKLLLGRLATCRTEQQRRAFLARAIAVVYSVRLEDVLNIHHDDIRITPSGVKVDVNGKTILISEQFSAPLLKFRQPGRSVFSGRGGFKPLSVDVTRYHVHRLGQNRVNSSGTD